jgi:hypothetical protein
MRTQCTCWVMNHKDFPRDLANGAECSFKNIRVQALDWISSQQYYPWFCKANSNKGDKVLHYDLRYVWSKQLMQKRIGQLYTRKPC